MSHPWIKLARHLQSPSEIGCQVENSLVTMTRPLWATLIQELWLMSWKSDGGGELHWVPSQNYPQSNSLPEFQTLSPGHLLLGSWLVDSGGAEILGWCSEVVVLEPPQRSWALGRYPQVEVQGSSDELLAMPVMMVASGPGTPAVWRRVAISVMTYRLAWIATRIWNVSSCAYTSFSFKGGDPLCSEKEGSRREVTLVRRWDRSG